MIKHCDQSNWEEGFILTYGFRGKVHMVGKQAAGSWSKKRNEQITSQPHKGIEKSNLKWGPYEVPELRPSDGLPPARRHFLKGLLIENATFCCRIRLCSMAEPETQQGSKMVGGVGMMEGWSLTFIIALGKNLCFRI